MKRNCTGIAAALLGVCILFIRSALADANHYGFVIGQDSIYQITVLTEYPDHTTTRIDFVGLRPISIDPANGQFTLTYDWGIQQDLIKYTDRIPFSFGGYPDFLTNGVSAGNPAGKQVIIDPQGTLVFTDIPIDAAQLDGEQGPAWKLPLQPLPAPGQTSYSVQHQLRIFDDKQQTFGPPDIGPGFGRFGGLFGFVPPPPNPFGPRPVRVETPATENISFTAMPAQGNLMTVERHYDLTCNQKSDSGDLNQHIHGDGQFVFDISRGRVVSLQWHLMADLTAPKGSVTIPISVNAHLVSDDELATLKTAAADKIRQAKVDAAQKVKQAEIDREKANLVDDVDKLPGDMGTTKAVG